MRTSKTIGVCFLLLIFSAVGAQAGTITGHIKYEGEVPNLRPIKMEADPICLTHHTSEVLPEILVLGDNKELANVFVYVKSGLPKKDYPVPAEPLHITQKGCQYSPHVVGVLKGQEVKIDNPDGTLHNVHALSKVNPEFNIAMPKFRKEISHVFEKEEFMFPLKCDVHPWMGAWVSVMAHPYFSVTDTTGTYTIDGLPAGEYEIEAWHEKMGKQTAKITVGETDTQEADFTFSKPGK